MLKSLDNDFIRMFDIAAGMLISSIAFFIIFFGFSTTLEQGVIANLFIAAVTLLAALFAGYVAYRAFGEAQKQNELTYRNHRFSNSLISINHIQPVHDIVSDALKLQRQLNVQSFLLHTSKDPTILNSFANTEESIFFTDPKNITSEVVVYFEERLSELYKCYKQLDRYRYNAPLINGDYYITLTLTLKIIFDMRKNVLGIDQDTFITQFPTKDYKKFMIAFYEIPASFPIPPSTFYEYDIDPTHSYYTHFEEEIKETFMQTFDERMDSSTIFSEEKEFFLGPQEATKED